MNDKKAKLMVSRVGIDYKNSPVAKGLWEENNEKLQYLLPVYRW